MTQEERAYNYASTQKPTKMQVGEIAKYYNDGYYQAMQDFLEKACEWLKSYRQETSDKTGYIAGVVNDETIEQFKNYMQNESEN